MSRTQLVPIAQALLAALLFGASAPFAKLLLGRIEPVPLAAFLYLGAGAGLLAWQQVQRLAGQNVRAEAAIQPPDLKWLAGAILAGGVAAPIVLLFSLRLTSGATGSLLLNFEGVATTLIAALIFREAISRRAAWALALITLASILLTTDPGGGWGLSVGALGVLAACLLWGLDNNFTFHISAKDPQAIVTIKGLAAGSVSLLLALLAGDRFPDALTMLKAMLLGSLSYGLSIVLFVHALRGLGAARTSALFATAPLAGMLLSFLFLGDRFSPLLALALGLMAAGALLMMNEEHTHRHVHEELCHEHAHVHDDGHHAHAHGDEEPGGEPHCHPHAHGGIEHEHHHMPELHHRHAHP